MSRSNVMPQSLSGLIRASILDCHHHLKYPLYLTGKRRRQEHVLTHETWMTWPELKPATEQTPIGRHICLLPWLYNRIRLYDFNGTSYEIPRDFPFMTSPGSAWKTVVKWSLFSFPQAHINTIPSVFHHLIFPCTHEHDFLCFASLR